MAEEMTGRAFSATIPQASTLGRRGAVVNLQFRGLAAVNDRALTLSLKATAPGTFGGIGTVVMSQQPLADTPPLSVSQNPLGGLDATCRIDLPGDPFYAAAGGDHLWACLFAVNPAITGSVPDLVVDLGEVF